MAKDMSRDGSWLAALKIWLPILVLYSSGQKWLLSRLSALDSAISENRIIMARIESTPPTAEDFRRLWTQVSEARDEVRALPGKLPPDWFVKRVDHIESNLEKLSAETAALATIVHKMDPKPGTE